MSHLTRLWGHASTLIGSAITGLVAGILGLSVACVTCLAITFQTHAPLELPGVFRSWFALVGGLPELRFIPDAGGMFATLVISTALGGALGALAVRRRSRASHRS